MKAKDIFKEVNKECKYIEGADSERKEHKIYVLRIIQKSYNDGDITYQMRAFLLDRLYNSLLKANNIEF